MNCREFASVASAILEGESHPEAYQHLAACRRCRLLADELGAIERAGRTLPVHEPSPRLWGRLAAAASREGLWEQPAWPQWSAPLWSLFPLRPAAVAVLGITVLLAAGFIGYPILDLPVSPAPPATAIEVAQGELVQEASYAARYHMQLKRVEKRVMAEAGPMDAELRQLTARPLGDVDRAIEQTQLRLSSYPDDTLARDELRWLYQQKATVLQAMADPAWMEVSR